MMEGAEREGRGRQGVKEDAGRGGSKRNPGRRIRGYEICQEGEEGG